MPSCCIRILTVLILALAVRQASAAGPGSGSINHTTPGTVAQTGPAHKAKKPSSRKRVDLNSATKEQLKTLPGITDELAAKIIAGRPYMTKAHLVTHHILPADLYWPLKDRVAAIQPRVSRK